VIGTEWRHAVLQFVLGTAALDKPGKLRSTLIGTALAGAVMLSGAGPVFRSRPSRARNRGSGGGHTGPQPTAAATQAAIPAATPVTLAPGLTGFDNIGADTSAQLVA
jgi:hypothetical protein